MNQQNQKTNDQNLDRHSSLSETRYGVFSQYSFFFIVSVTALILLGLVFIKVQITPAPFFTYVQGTMLLPLGFFSLLLVSFHKTRATVAISFVASVITLLSLTIFNQILFWFGKIISLPDNIINYGEPVLFTSMLFLANFILSRFSKYAFLSLPVTVTLLHLGYSVTLLALFLKLESHPLSAPYADPSVIVWPSLIYGLIGLITASLFKHRKEVIEV